MLESDHGLLIGRVQELDFALRSRFTVSLEETTAEEFQALKIWRFECDRFDREQQQQQRQQQQQQQRQ